MSYFAVSFKNSDFGLLLCYTGEVEKWKDGGSIPGKEAMPMYIGVQILLERSNSLTVYEALQLMFDFGMTLLTSISLIVAIIDRKNKK